MAFTRVLAFTTVLSLFGMGLAHAHQEVTRPLGTGTVNWSAGTIRVTGAGAPPAQGLPAQKRLMTKRAAVADAYRQLAEAVNGVQVFSETTVKNYVTESDVIRLQVSAVIRGARQVGTERYLSDGSIEVDVEMPVFGTDSLAQGLNFGEELKERAGMSISAQPIQLAWAGNPYQIAQAMGILPWSVKPQQPWSYLAQSSAPTGLIVDAGGLGAEPAMGPFLIASARRVYTSNDIGVNPDLVVQKGPVHYVEDIKEAKQDKERVGDNPLVVRAKGVTGKTGTDILLDEDTTKQILEANAQGKFLEQVKVSLVI